MPAFFHLDLDTISPVVTWGAVSAVSPGRLVTIDYTIDEPQVVAAQFVDANDVATNMDVAPTRLRVFVPATTPLGEAVVRAWVQDDVGNTAVRSLTVQVQSAYVHLDLDTTPPIITWGPIDGTEPGEDLTALYALDEPDITNAELQLLDGRVLPMQIGSDRLTVSLPFDIPDGLATIRAHVRDDVGNEADRTLVVLLSGVLPPPPQVSPFVGGGPPQRVVVKPRFVTSARSAVRARPSHAGVEAMRVVDPVVIRTRIQYARPAQIVRLISHGVITTRGDQVAAITSEPSVAFASAHFSTAKRSEGPQAEAELLLLLDLL